MPGQHVHGRRLPVRLRRPLRRYGPQVHGREPAADAVPGNSKHLYESERSLINGYLSWVRFKMPPDRRNLKTLYELLSLGNDARDAFFAQVEATYPSAGGSCT